MNYQEAIKYLESFINYEKFISFDYKESMKLERMKRLAHRLGDPQAGLKCIHVAGTKGKGSTCAMVSSILKEAGFSVGLYTSPHLVSFRERIRINGELISEADICIFTDKLKTVIDKIDKKSDEYPTFFEVYTALAFLYFKEKSVDLCVIETGLGGRLDATNIVRPLCCGITHISLEHTQKLGNTISKIAFEKAGIIKEEGICVSSPQEGPAINVIRKACKDRNCRLFEAGKEAYLQKYPNLEIGLLGEHQLVNAAVAIGLVESLRFYDIIIGYNEIRKGLKNVKWPGRLQVLGVKPYIILDGAQNRASAGALKEAIKKIFNYDKLILVLGASRDKDIKGICEELVPLSDNIILTRASLPRAAEPVSIKNYIRKEALITSSVEAAINMAEAMAGERDLILVTGSLFVIGEVLANRNVKELNYA